MAVRVANQLEFGGAWEDPVAITYTATATAGNLLIAGITERNGAVIANHTCDDDGTGGAWTLLVGHDHNKDDPTYRHCTSIWYKFSDGDEDTVTLDDGTGNSKFGFIDEYELEAGDAWGEILGTSSAGVENLGTSESLNSGNTAAIAGTNFLVLSFSSLKTGQNYEALSMTFNSGINNAFGYDNENAYEVAIACADLNDSTTGVRSDTANMSSSSGDNQRSFISMIAVFDLSDAGGGSAVTKDGAITPSGVPTRHFAGARAVAGEL